ncbi:DUF5958 family protein [Myroides guanonis]|uniref:Uncharacterized protein n=1 Tax=Myroides guanonis TaxID=1150112 RepID=A0A1I3U1J3_9FLAO|nr:DUF5958 family protein [Myroides guanonis]SFJ76782.1 hypothetical protein SAMN04487893_11588 [Myroides guanonis]
MIENLINRIAQNKIDFEIGSQTILNEHSTDFQTILAQLKNYIFNSIPNKTNYNSETYQNAINTIPLKQTSTPIVILKTFPTKIAFNKLEQLPESEQHKVIISLLWIFKETDSQRLNTECKNGCEHKWHNVE